MNETYPQRVPRDAPRLPWLWPAAILTGALVLLALLAGVWQFLAPLAATWSALLDAWPALGGLFVLLVASLVAGVGIHALITLVRRLAITRIGGVPIDVRTLRQVNAQTLMTQHYTYLQAQAEHPPLPQGYHYAPQVTLSQAAAPALPAPAAILQDGSPTPLSADDWMAFVNDQLDRVPHLAVIGPSGAGKTTLAMAVLAGRLGDVIILTAKEGDSWGGLPYIGIDDDTSYTTARRVCAVLDQEVKARNLARKRREAQPDILTVVFDDFSTLVGEAPIAAQIVKVVGRIGRSLQVRLIMLSDSDQVKALGMEGEGESRRNFAAIRIARGHRATLAPDLVDGERQPIDLADVPRLAARPLDPTRAWQPPQLAAPDPLLDQLLEVAPPPQALTPTQPLTPLNQMETIVVFLQHMPDPQTAQDIAAATGIAVEQVYKHVGTLSGEGRIVRHGRARNYTYTAVSSFLPGGRTSLSA